MFSPGLESLHDVALDAGVLEENPGFINQERLEYLSCVGIGDQGIRPVQDIEEQRFKKLRVFPHSLKVEALEPAEADRVLDIIEQGSELPRSRPFMEPVRKMLGEDVREYRQGPKPRVNGIQVLDLLKQIA